MCWCVQRNVVTRHSDKPWVTDGFRAIVRKRHDAHVMHNNHVKAILIHKNDEVPAE